MYVCLLVTACTVLQLRFALISKMGRKATLKSGQKDVNLRKSPGIMLSRE